MPTPQRLPIVNSDDGQWGDILNQFLKKEHFDDGTDNAINGGHKTITLQPGTTSAGTAPLKLSSGSLLTSPEAGAIEFLTDRLYFTQTNSTTRKVIAAFNDASGATGDLYYRDSGGHFTRLGIGSSNDVLTVSGGLPSWQPGSLDSDLTTIAGLSPSNDDILQRKSGAWTNRTLAQYRADLNYEARTTFNDADYTILSTDRYVAQIGTLSNNRTVTLPAANSVPAGYQIKVIDESGSIGAYIITVVRAGADTIINGVAGVGTYIVSPYACTVFVSDGSSKWSFVYSPNVSLSSSGSVTGGDFAMFSTSGVLNSTGLSLDTDTSLTANSDTKIASQKAIKAFITSGSVNMTNKTLTTPVITFGSTAKTSNYNATTSDTVIFINAASGSVAITLPLASSATGTRYFIKRIDSSGNSATIVRSSSDTIDGATSQSLDLQYTSITVVSDGSNWYII